MYPSCAMCFGSGFLQPPRVAGVKVGPKYPCPMCGPQRRTQAKKAS